MLDSITSKGNGNDYKLLLDKINAINNDLLKKKSDKILIIKDGYEILKNLVVSGGFPSLFDICLLITEFIESENRKLKKSDLNKITNLSNLIEKYVITPDSNSTKDEIIICLSGLGIMSISEESTMLRQMLDIYEYEKDTDTETHAPDESYKTEYRVIDEIDNDEKEILEIFLNEYIQIKELTTQITNYLNADNNELSKNKIKELKLMIEYYCEAVQTTDYHGFSALINQIHLMLAKESEDDAGISGNFINSLDGLNNKILHYLTNPYNESIQNELVEHLKNECPFEITDKQIEKLYLKKPVTDSSNGKGVQNITDQEAAELKPDDISIAINEDIDQELLDAMLQELPFQAESLNDLIASMNNQNYAEILPEAKRIAHTLKGAANTVGVKGIAILTHKLEDILVFLGKQNRALFSSELNLLEEASDCLSEMSEQLMVRGSSPESAFDLVNQLIDTNEKIIKGEYQPDQEFTRLDPGITKPVPVKNIADQNKNDETATIRIPLETIDKLLRLSGENIIVSRLLQNQISNIKKHINETNEYYDTLRMLNNKIDKFVDIKDLSLPSISNNEKYDRLEMENYNELHSCSKHLIEVIYDVEEMNNELQKIIRKLEDNITRQINLNSESQENIFKTSMVPVKNISNRLQRCVRQTAKLSNKNVNLDILGEEILIDNSTLNNLLEPLSHLLRNAVDHGIEDIDTRINNGKSPDGKITITFSIDSNYIKIICSDDGKGIDYELIKKKALDQNLISKEEINTDIINNILFHPGFSTKSDVTQVSGRGIGMDVVKNAVMNMSGSIRTESELGIKTDFIIKVPQNAQNIFGIQIQQGKESIILSNRGIKHVFLNDTQLKISEENAEIKIKGKNYKYKKLDELLFLDSDRREEMRGRGVSIIIEYDEKEFAILTERIIGCNYFIVKSMGEYIPRISGILGITILENGLITPVYDLIELLENPLKEKHKSRVYKKIIDEKKPKALVVDDSLSARKSLVHFMEDTGYQVRSARDGLDAFNILKYDLPDIVLTDLEMPNMDGIELTKHIRSDKRLSTLPVIMITSRSTDKHKSDAINTGVNEVLTKPYSEVDLFKIIKNFAK